MLTVPKHKFRIFVMFFLLWPLSVNTQPNNDIDSSLAFKVGNISVTRYELQKNIAPMIDKYTQKFTAQPPDDSIKTWKNNFVNKFYFAADAYEKGYYQDAIIESMVNDMACYMLTQKRGLVEKKTIEKAVTLDENSLPEFYKKRRYKYYFDFIKFKSTEQLKGLLGDTAKIKTAKQFSSLMSNLESNPEILSSSVDGCPWPFVNVWDICDQIYELETGEVSNFIEGQTGIYAVYLKKKELAESESYEQFIHNFPGYYRIAKGEWLINNYENSIIEKSAMQINPENLDLLYSCLNKLENKKQIDKDYAKDISHLPILTYKVDSITIEKSIQDFINSYSKNIFRSAITSKETLESYITRMVIEDYLIKEAKHLGLTKEEKFVLDRRNYKNNLVCYKYYQNELNISPITENDIIEEYGQQKENFAQPVGGLYLVLEFYNLEYADSALNKLEMLGNNIDPTEQCKSLELPGLLNPDLTDTVNYLPHTSSTNTQECLKGKIAGPEKSGNVYKVFYKIKEPHIEYKPVDEIYIYLYHSIQEKRQAKAKLQLLPGLQKKYELLIFNIN